MSTDSEKDAGALAAASASASASTIRSGIAMQEQRQKDTRSRAEIQADALKNRAELAATLDAIEYRVNVPKRVGNRLRVLREENPAALAALGVGVAAAVSLAIWLAVRVGSK